MTASQLPAVARRRLFHSVEPSNLMTHIYYIVIVSLQMLHLTAVQP
jgi:hypothetical protein